MYRSPVQSTKGDKTCNVAVPIDWVNGCDPEKGYVTPELRGLLKETERQLA